MRPDMRGIEGAAGFVPCHTFSTRAGGFIVRTLGPDWFDYAGGQ
jgi:hypothetical protein